MTRTLLVVYPHLPHYRYGVFRALVEDPDLDVTFAAGPSARDGTIATVPLDEFASIRLRNTWLGPFLWQRGLLRHLLRHRYDAVLMLGDVKYLSTWVAAALLRMRRGPVLLWTIGWHRPDRGVVRLIRLAFYRLADSLALYGHVARDLGEQMGYPVARMHVIGNSCTSVEADNAGSDDPRIEAALSNLRPTCLLMIGRLTTVKSLDLVIEAVASLPRLCDEVTVVLAGEGPERAGLEALASRRGVDVRLPGAVYAGRHLARLYSAADLTVIPGAAGLTVVQSLEHGVPVVTHDSPYQQMPEAEAVVPGRTGALFRRGDSGDLARVIVEWLDASVSRDEVAEACRNEVRRNWSSTVHAHRISAAVEATVRKATG